MTRAEYDALPAVNYSTIKHIARSPLHYRYACENDTQPDTDAMVLGRVTHLAVFEPEKLATHVAVWEGRRAGKEWEAFEAEHAHQEIIKPELFATALAMGKSARVAAGKLLSEGESEIVMQWTDAETGIRCKGRLDHISRGFGIIDLKTTADASALAFGRRAAALQYPVQSAMYTDGAEANGWCSLPYTILAVESRAPYAATLYTVTADHIDQGRETYRGWLRTVKACQDSGIWPSYPPGVLSLPRWAEPSVGADDQDVSEFFKETDHG
jgi:PDDEXK-like domain of unknown function (DUF3799)